MSMIWTWFFNNAGQSVFFAMLVHGVSNAASGLIPQLPLDAIGDPWFSLKTGTAFALLLIQTRALTKTYKDVNALQDLDLQVLRH